MIYIYTYILKKSVGILFNRVYISVYLCAEQFDGEVSDVVDV